MKKIIALMAAIMMFNSFYVSAMQPYVGHNIMTIDEFERKINAEKIEKKMLEEYAAKDSTAVLKNENAYAQALYDGDLDRVQFFLQRYGQADQFRKFPGADDQFIGKGAGYSQFKPIDVVWMGRAPQRNKFAILEILFELGADADKQWRNQQLRFTAIDKDEEFAKWLRAHGAQ